MSTPGVFAADLHERDTTRREHWSNYSATSIYRALAGCLQPIDLSTDVGPDLVAELR